MLLQLFLSRTSQPPLPAPERAHLGAELEELYGADKFDAILAQIDFCLPKDAAGNFIPEQEKSDVLQDLLAFLAERMLEMNKPKQQDIKGFLSWLQGFIGTRVEDLTPKTKLQGYYDHDFDAFLAVLKEEQEEAKDQSRSKGACRGASGRRLIRSIIKDKRLFRYIQKFIRNGKMNQYTNLALKKKLPA